MGDEVKTRLAILAATLLALSAISWSHVAADNGPLLPRVPGERYHAVSQATIDSTICVRGWTRTIRPPSAYTSALKRWQLKDLGYSDRDPGVYQEDHLISLELGGAPYSTDNLWPQPQSQARPDDQRENRWRELVCSGGLTLRQGQRAELAWKRAHG
jgi:hypothetical protein